MVFLIGRQFGSRSEEKRGSQGLVLKKEEEIDNCRKKSLLRDWILHRIISLVGHELLYPNYFNNSQD